MKSFFKILKFVLPYKYLLLAAVVFSILFSISNGLTIYSIVPIIDSLVESDKPFNLAISKGESELLAKKNLTLTDVPAYYKAQFKYLINSYFQTKTKKEILLTVSLLIIPLVLLRGLFDFIARLLFAYAGNKAVLNIRKDLFSHLIKLPYNYFHTSRSGELITRITQDVVPLTSAVSTDIYNFISGIILLIINLIILSIMNWQMIIFILIIMPFIAFPISYFGNLVKKNTKKLQEGFADIGSHLQETLSGIKVIKSFGMETYEKKKFSAINQKIFSRDLRRRIYQNLSPAIVELLGTIAASALFLYGGYQIINSQISTGEFIFFMILILNLFEPVKNISEAINGTKAGEAASARIFHILEYAAEDFNSGKTGSFTKSINFNNVFFKYNDNELFSNLCLEIEKGKTTAIVGTSGSGKSTILNLLSSFYFPEKGGIYFDDSSINDLTLDFVRSKIAIVTQEVVLFHSSVTDNLACGARYEMDRIIEASKIAHAHEFIMKLPNGYDTVIGERGALLSGGERQRISIARAVLAQPEIILFDEATSALDSESEQLIRDSLNFLFKDRTSVIVSHRLSTIKNADIIYVLSNGKIIDKGKHDELLLRSEYYGKLFQSL